MSIIPRFFGGRWSKNPYDPFSLDIWEPLQDLSFPLDTSRPDSSKEITAVVITHIDWKETPEAHIFKADVPGLTKEEVKVEIHEGRVLEISGEKNKEKEEKNSIWHRIERGFGKFLRRFRLPSNAKTDETKASMENGVLTVTVPKEEVKEKAQAYVKEVEISG